MVKGSLIRVMDVNLKSNATYYTTRSGLAQFSWISLNLSLKRGNYGGSPRWKRL